MGWQLLANVVLVAHLCFIAFVACGGFAAVRWPRLAWVHLPCAAWGALIEFAGWICPLTPLENHLRALGGSAGYSGGFVERYLLPIIYPGALTRGIQIGLGIAVIALNLAAYGWLLRRRLTSATTEDRAAPAT